MNNKATEFSIKFLEILEEDLKVENVDIGSPTFIPSAINNFSFQKLSSNLEGLVYSSLREKATDDLYNLADTKNSGVIVTTGVGMSDEFHEFVKLGYLLGDKVVLWDSILPNILSSQNGINPTHLGEYLFNILKLKEVVKKGDLLYLPHPRIWCDETKYYFSKVSSIPNVTNEFTGMLNAWTLNKSGLNLFPYLMHQTNPNSKSLRDSLYESNDHFDADKLDYNNSLIDLLKYQSFSFLSEIDIIEFHKIVKLNSRYKEFKSELHSKFSNFNALSDDEKKLHTKSLLETLSKEISKESSIINKRFGKRINETAASLSVIGSAVGASFNISTSAALITFLAGLAGSYSSIRKLISDFKNPEEPSVFYQIFSKMEMNVEQEIMEREATEERLKKWNIQKNI